MTDNLNEDIENANKKDAEQKKQAAQKQQEEHIENQEEQAKKQAQNMTENNPQPTTNNQESDKKNPPFSEAMQNTFAKSGEKDSKDQNPIRAHIGQLTNLLVDIQLKLAPMIEEKINATLFGKKTNEEQNKLNPHGGLMAGLKDGNLNIAKKLGIVQYDEETKKMSINEQYKDKDVLKTCREALEKNIEVHNKSQVKLSSTSSDTKTQNSNLDRLKGVINNPTNNEEKLQGETNNAQNITNQNTKL